MSSRRDHGSGTPSNASNRQNEYFIPRDGIDREVITADICRYLGNDALVRPGTYEDKKTGRVIQGYFVTAYRNLTSAMIADLKADSARWDQERRNHSGARYSDSQHRFSGAGLSQYDTSGTIYPSGPSRDSYESVPRYPGSDAPGYSASTGSQPYHQDNRQSGYGAYQPSAYPSQQSPYAGAQYQTQPPTNPVSDSPYYSAANMLVAAPPSQQHHRSQDPYQDSRIAPPSSRDPYSNPAPVYGSQGVQGQIPSSYYQSAYPPQQPGDAFAGRQPYGSSTSPSDYPPSSTSQVPMYERQYEPQPQYENQTPPPSRPVASSSSQAQTGHSGSSHARRSDRERDRDDRPRRR
ncbi:hypothetical protein INS49_001426 [Diaporthe citri]|uniref:uncharacterized protein n=1 Tax=Diaporthe citri TaxID=83186 RepID=UPI001C7F84D5|nr:uncharacterized protein INS49_001426 [Diaporthe citri]KAG6367241.1 hypothetical protein INS49_001426 [Diaporthe citri]